MFVCEVCKKEYQSRSGMRRHLKSKHAEEGLPAMPAPVETAGGDEGTEVTKAGEGPASERSEDQPVSDRPACNAGRPVSWLREDRPPLDKDAKRACKELGIDEDKVMAFKVYHDHEPLKVVLIEGPVGFKRVWLAK